MLNNLKKKRIKKGLSQRELSVKANINVRMIQKYEQGVIDIENANILTLLKIAIGLECDLIELVTNEELINILNKYESRNFKNAV